MNLCLSGLKWLAFSQICIELPVNRDVIRLIDGPPHSWLFSILFEQDGYMNVKKDTQCT